MAIFVFGERNFHPSDLDKLGLNDELFGFILGTIEDEEERSNKGKREIFMIQYSGLREYFVETGVINKEGEVDEEKINLLTESYIFDRIKRRGLR